MHIKRFEAATLQAALDQVRSELGPDALILSSRTIRPASGRFGFMARERVEVQAALEREVDRRAVSVPSPDEFAALDRSRHSREPADERAAHPDAGLAALVEELRRELAAQRTRERFEEEVRSELRGLRSALAGALGRGLEEQVDPVVASLVRRGIDWVHAQSVVRDCREQGGRDDWAALSAQIGLRLESRVAPPRPQDADRLRILVGAPGVGKTTSLAKLAARNEEGERDVALVSLDHFRIGASEQLKRYAEFLDAPFCELSGPAELPRLVERFRGRAILVDTPGRDRGSDADLDSLAPIRKLLGRRASIELVVDATARREVQRAQLERFAPLLPDRLIVAKVDECDSLAEVANLLLDPDGPPVCWLGTGQRVPEDLAEIEPARIVRDVMGQAA